MGVVVVVVVSKHWPTWLIIAKLPSKILGDSPSHKHAFPDSSSLNTELWLSPLQSTYVTVAGNSSVLLIWYSIQLLPGPQQL